MKKKIAFILTFSILFWGNFSNPDIFVSANALSVHSAMLSADTSSTVCVRQVRNETLAVDTSQAAATQPGENELYSRSCALMDGDSGRVLYGKDEQNTMANASTTKIMTCIIALENAEDGLIAEASPNAASQPKVHLGMSSGQQFYVKDLLYGLMLESYNDCAVAIAEAVAGSVEAFAEMMNEKAKQLGCHDTYFITPNGLDAQDENGFHHTTAEDLCRIMKYCAWDSPKSAEFLEITQTASYTITSLDGRSYSASNKNAFLTMMDGVISGKTGFTADAGYCYVAALESEGRRFCIALLACGWPNNRTYKWSDARKLFSYAMDNFSYVTVPRNLTLPEIALDDAREQGSGLASWKQTLFLSPVADYGKLPEQYLLPVGQEISYRYFLNEHLHAPVHREDIVGSLTYYAGKEVLWECPVYAGTDYESWDFRAVFRELVKMLFAGV